MLNKKQFISLISSADFKELFISELGWNMFRGSAVLPTIAVDEVGYNFTSIAERNGFQIITCSVDTIPTNSICKKIDTKLRRQANDYIAIYQLKDSDHHLWVVPVKSNEKRDLVLVEYENAQKADLLYSKIDGFSFDLGESTTIVDLRAKVQGAFAVNSEKITKDFYSGFRKEHSAFVKFISGIDDHLNDKDNKNKQWYTSIMLNRLMFCYFIQKKGFLNLDFDYLRHKLEWVSKEKGENNFFSSFYRGFLVQLFHDGLNAPVHNAKFEQIYGKIPYLNGGMFDTHFLEEKYPEIEIKDEAFIRLFDFFDTWRWHLDTRITASGKDINPDVLGYIFEQYINDRAQMGAYYTKEDITEYIGRNCILPFLFDKVAEKEKATFKPDGFVWSTLKNSGDKYIFDAVKKGYSHLGEIPENISRGIITDAMRKEYSETPVGELPESHIPLSELRSEWNKPTPEKWALPTEIWRETIERLQRCESIIGKIKGGEINSINDFITYNLDIRSFTLDLLSSADNSFIRHFYEALQGITILDPTCGSGAFLFAAMNILEPLYETCIEHMQENPTHFKKELSEISDTYQSNIQYFIFKSIILRNLYGVDIMVEATEIAKLRLFLKMVAVVDVDRRKPNLGLDPLPDIDFNIRCGNTLVGYANEEQLLETLRVNKENSLFFEDEIAQFRKKIEDELNTISKTYNTFKCLQLEQEINQTEFKIAKAELQKRLTILNALLNEQLFDSEHQEITGNREQIFNKWLKSHQPFHWLAEFYQIIKGNGGFDVIIGNPPYVEYSKVRNDYQISNYETVTCGNLYAYVIERCFGISNSSVIGMIIPTSSISTDRMKPLQHILFSHTIFYSTYGFRPAKLFDGGTSANIHLSICILNDYSNSHLATNHIKWNATFRNVLFQSALYYTGPENSLNSFFNKTIRSKNEIQDKILVKLTTKEQISKYLSVSKHNVYYRSTGGLHYRVVTLFPTYSRKEAFFSFEKNNDEIIFCALASNLWNMFYYSMANCLDVSKNDILYFPIGIKEMTDKTKQDLHQLSLMLNNDLLKNSRTIIRHYENIGDVECPNVSMRLSKPIIDEIDKVLAGHYGFTDEELDFIINYDIKYRMGDELGNE